MKLLKRGDLLKPLFIHYDGHRTHAYGGMREIKKKNRKWLSLMIALSITLGGMSFYSEVAADGGQQIHGISVNVEPGGEPGNNYNNDGAGYLGVAIGNRASSLAGYGTAIGPYAKADALYSNATGFWAQALGQYSAAYGAGARAINDFGVAFGQGAVVSFGKPLSEAEYNTLPESYKKIFTAVKTEAGTTVYYQTKILLQDGSTQDQSVFSVAIGASAAATDNYAVAIGFKSSADEMGSLSIGAYSEAKGKQGLALGYVAKAIGDFSTAVGQWSQANGDHAVAIGYGAITEKNKAGVAIGYESHSMRIGGKGWNPITDQVWDGSEAQIEALGLKEKVKALDEEIAQKQALEQQAKEELAKFPNDPNLIEKARVAHNEKAKADEKKNKLFATWKTPTGDVAVGNIDTGMTRQITGVAAGSEDTDAVNVAQLKALNRKNVAQFKVLNGKVDTLGTKIEDVKNIADGTKIHYFSVGPDNEKNYSAGENYNNDGVEQHGGIAIGFDASSKDGDGIAIGKSAHARDWESTGIGALTYSVGNYSTAMGTRAQAFGESASAYGSLARAYGANGVAIGTGSLVASKKAITKAAFDALPEEQQALYNIDKVNPKEFYQYKIKDKDGDIKDIETNGTAVGNYASSIGIGGVAVGDHAKSSDIDNVNGSNFGVAIGAYSQNKVAQGVALGTLSVADRAGNILGYLPTKNGSIEYLEDAMEAVGQGKEFTELKNEYAQVQEQMNAAKAASDGDPTNTDLKTKYEQAKQKFDALTNKFAIMTAPWTSRKGAVSIGNDKKGQTRQIIGVAAGSEDTDAVNVAQLKALAMLPMNMYFGGKGENNTYTPGKENWSMPLNEFRMDFGDGLKATQVTDKNGKKYTLVTLDKESLKGDPAFKGDKGESGQAGKDGTNGKSAYDIWLDKQTDKTKTEQDFLNSLKGEKGENGATGAAGKDGTNGKSAYDIWLDKQTDKTKTEQDFLNSLKGEKGENGATGAAGKDGTNGKSAYDIWLDKQTDKTKTEQDFFDSLKGEKGATGQTGAIGAAGKSAYQVWKEQQNPDGSKPNENKTEQEFFNSLKGKDGKDGKNGVAAAVTVKASEKGNDIQEAKFVITPQKPEMTFVGDRNIKTLIEKDNTVKIALQDTITAKTIKVGDKVTITKEGATFDKVTIAGNQGSITGLTNTTWDTTRIVSGRAATEDQVQQATQTMQRQMVNDMNGIAAGNAALAGLHPLAYDDRDKWNLSAAIGKYRGADAVAFGAFYRPNETTQVSLSGAFGTGRHMLMNAGVAWKVGGGSLPGSSKMAMARQLAAQQWEIEQLRRKDRERDKEMAAMKEREAQLWKEVALLKSKT